MVYPSQIILPLASKNYKQANGSNLYRILKKDTTVDNKLLLSKSLSLLYRESQMTDNGENSAALVRTVLESVQVSDIGIGLNSDREVIMALKTTILEMCGMPQDHTYDATDLLQRIRLNCGNDERLYEAIKQGIEDELSEGSLKRSVLNMRKSINNHFREEKVNDILGKASAKFRFQREKVPDINHFINEIIAQLEPLQMTVGGKDPTVIDELDLGSEESLNSKFNDVQNMNSGKKVYKTGWPAINDMLQGGFRPGETWVFGGLQHKYKTGFNLSLFAQIALLNKPLNVDPAKKPLMLFMSTEDSLVNSLQFLYQFIIYSETRQFVDIQKASVAEMVACIKQKFEANGFHVKMMRIEPSTSTYKSICNKIVELESQGYVVEVLNIDYLYKVSKVGCETGALGHDVMDQLSRVRNFCAARNTLFLTPHQLSAGAKQLLRGPIAEADFVKEIAGRGFFEGSSTIDRIYDGCLLIHLFKQNKEAYFSIQLDKHRLPTVVDEDKKYIIFKFPHKMPIPYSLNDEDESFTKMQAAPSNTSDDLFKLG